VVSCLTIHEPSRAGPATMANLYHFDELRCPPGSDSGEVLGGIWVLQSIRLDNVTQIMPQFPTLQLQPNEPA